MTTITHKSFEFNHEIEWLNSDNGRFYLRIISPQLKRASLRNSMKGCYCFATSDRRDVYLNTWRIEQQAKLDARTAKKTLKDNLSKSFVNPYKVGEILHSSWGYDQTNVEWFEIVEVKARSICIRQINAKVEEWNSSMSGTSYAQPGQYVGERIWKTIQLRVYDNKLSCSVCSPIYGNLYKSEGELKASVSWYH